MDRDDAAAHYKTYASFKGTLCKIRNNNKAVVLNEKRICGAVRGDDGNLCGDDPNRLAFIDDRSRRPAGRSSSASRTSTLASRRWASAASGG